MKVLISGGFGFIGGRLAQYFSLAGHQVVLGSRSPRSSPAWLPDATVSFMDWDDIRVLEKSCLGVDLVIHAAGMNAQDCASDPLKAFEFNGLGTTRLLRASCTAGVRRFIYISTAHVYASPLAGVITEENLTANPHPYATSHLVGENAVLAAAQQREIEGIVLRLSNAFGAPMHRDVNCWTLLANDLCKQVAVNGEMVLRSSGLQQRDFIALADVCRVVGHMTLLAPQFVLPGVINVGSGVSQSVLEFAALIRQRSKLILGFEPLLHRPLNSDGESHKPLTYLSGKLRQMGIELKSDYAAEIDRLLVFCQGAFPRSRPS